MGIRAASAVERPEGAPDPGAAVLAYLGRLAAGSRATMRTALENLAELAGAPRDALAFPRPVPKVGRPETRTIPEE